MSPGYPFPPRVILPLVFDLLRKKQRDFQRDARICVSKLSPPLQVEGEVNIPQQGPCLLTVNHYTSPGFHTWWLTLATSAVLPVPIHWVITSAWISPNCLYSATITPFSHWLFHRIAETYGFTSMPPMPPRQGEEADRAKSVRQVLRYARKNPNAFIGLAPEGADSPGGVLACPPSGAGRFISQLARIGFSILPCGVFEQENSLQLNCGPVYQLPGVQEADPESLDRQTAEVVMRSIARLLPENLQGGFRGL